MSLEGYRDKLTRLRIGRSGPHKRPHKPAFLLAIMSMVETGRMDGNRYHGMTLCKNHHWAMDHHLIAPTTALAWRISASLDDRIEGQKDLIDLDGRSVILPKQPRYQPKPESLQWREDRLATT